MSQWKDFNHVRVHTKEKPSHSHMRNQYTKELTQLRILQSRDKNKIKYGHAREVHAHKIKVYTSSLRGTKLMLRVAGMIHSVRGVD